MNLNLEYESVRAELVRESEKRSGNVVEARRRPKVQHTPHCLRGKLSSRFYDPKLISFGPLLIKDPVFWEAAAKYKFMWTSKYLQDTNQSFDHLFQTISVQLDDLEKLFVQDIYEHGDKLVTSLILDACSILHVLDKTYSSNSPEQELNISVDELIRVHDDILLLHNQIPFRVFKIVCNDEAKVKRCLRNLLKIHGFMRTGNQDLEGSNDHTIVSLQANGEEDPVHLLDYLHKAILTRSGDALQIPNEEIAYQWRALHLRKYRIGSIRELKAAGIRVKKYHNDTFSHPHFDGKTLHLPVLTVDGSTAVIFMNLVAYEMCPDFNNDFEISSYIVFMSSLIEHPEDVKELRSDGIVINELATDKEVADIFNKLDTLLVPQTARYAVIRDRIQMHFVSKSVKIKVLGWVGDAYNTYFHSPWTIIALLAAALGLTLTFIQTWFAIHPKKG